MGRIILTELYFSVDPGFKTAYRGYKSPPYEFVKQDNPKVVTMNKSDRLVLGSKTLVLDAFYNLILNYKSFKFGRLVSLAIKFFTQNLFNKFKLFGSEKIK